SGPAPTKGLIYAKTRIDQPFQTWEQIEQRIKRGGLSVAEQDELWESLFLSIAQVEKLLAHVKKTADGWMARCPGHPDKTPSLSVCTGDDGRTLFHCKAGCQTEKVCAALGIKMADLFCDKP
ncbi:MAG: CHC2 zinc finger domain-containing protein, partial [Candidatus Micrarchaeaceae archaeon]